MARTYSTRDGDVVDRIAYAHYGEQSPAILRAVFDANPGLAARGPVLPAGVALTLPEVQRPASERKGVALWD
ncbi:tail protein X [Stenotrophomonas maltophilia]|uniref:tail protein X n=1 Tax=Stenotrophomonas maltophilia TaxID=40324 RepID=UPI00066CB49A|nr:tail protein X [Stenotrophomonas maltophilia]MBH1676432.1 tail protein X [Stenotrophomonas maltophilia]MDZ5780316.1 tail protein X [Stenotrophomonas maltophilia]NUH60556.1 tail protein X [Stenotrophomonas maltophilia]HDS1622890.1 tail protein X [Stenotrophomonas maltophilia]HEL3198986.1 tail protein X [Stenotrophomonas maltophilia]